MKTAFLALVLATLLVPLFIVLSGPLPHGATYALLIMVAGALLAVVLVLRIKLHY